MAYRGRNILNEIPLENSPGLPPVLCLYPFKIHFCLWIYAKISRRIPLKIFSGIPSGIFLGTVSGVSEDISQKI